MIQNENQNNLGGETNAKSPDQDSKGQSNSSTRNGLRFDKKGFLMIALASSILPIITIVLNFLKREAPLVTALGYAAYLFVILFLLFTVFLAAGDIYKFMKSCFRRKFPKTSSVFKVIGLLVSLLMIVGSINRCSRMKKGLEKSFQQRIRMRQNAEEQRQQTDPYQDRGALPTGE